MVMQHSSSALRCTRLHRAMRQGGRHTQDTEEEGSRAAGQQGSRAEVQRCRGAEAWARRPPIPERERRKWTPGCTALRRRPSCRRNAKRLGLIASGGDVSTWPPCNVAAADGAGIIMCEVVAMMKEHMQPRGDEVASLECCTAGPRKLHDTWMERLSPCRHSQCRVYNGCYAGGLESINQSPWGGRPTVAPSSPRFKCSSSLPSLTLDLLSSVWPAGVGLAPSTALTPSAPKTP